MKENDWKNRLNVVYSTNPNFQYEKEADVEEPETFPKDKQLLKVLLDKKNRKGKKVTLVTGFTGKDDDLQALGKLLKTQCGVGGAVKESEIIIQGDFRSRVRDILLKEGYSKTKII
ncbi:MAG: translation initiation factor [Candidatus Azobacteroides sp.]|nr:translation initiation factor [Candidatus Azobacteroides sp.]